MAGRSTSWGALALTAMMMCVSQAQSADNSGALPVREVVLYKDGVGYFVRAGKVTGDQEIALRFQADQMNDLLMSLTALDLGGGQITSIVYDATNTVQRQLSRYTFNLDAVTGMQDLLPQLKGAQVELKLGTETVTGAVVGVAEEKQIVEPRAVVSRWKLTLMTQEGMLRTVYLGEAESVRFTDERLQTDLEKYLTVLLGRHKREEKTLVLRSEGTGTRDVMAAYVVETPVWKATYRLVVDEKDHKGQPLLQGWAIVDNVSEEDWKDVRLTLVAGMPVSFIQNLYDPWWKKRPVVQVEEEVTVGPQVYERTYGVAEGLAQARGGREMDDDANIIGGAAAPAPGASVYYKDGHVRYSPAQMAKAREQQLMQTVTREAGDLFQYEISHPVTIERDRSALIPIVGERIKGETVSIYNESQRAKNPMSAIRLENTTKLTLEGGPITVLRQDGNQESFAGEALIDTVKPDEKPYIGYAVDLGTHITTKFDSSSTPVFKVIINRGTMHMQYKQVETKNYTIENVDDREKTVVVEHPLRTDYALLSPAKPLGKTENFYRFEVKVPAKQTVTLPVKEERQMVNTYAITNITSDQIAFFVGQKYLLPEVRKFLEEVVALKGQIVSTDRLIQDRDRQYQDSIRKQGLLSKSLEPLGESTQEKALRAKYVTQLETELDRMNALEIELEGLREQRRQLQEQLDQKLGGFQKQYEL